MRVVVDRDLCEANGICVVHAPEVFLLDDTDEIHVLEEHPDEARREHVEQAARNCPKQAIFLEG